MPSIVYCTRCGRRTTGKRGVSKLCWDCHCLEKALRAEAEQAQTLENRRASRRNWYYEHKEHALTKAKEWKDANKDRVQQYEQEHVVERRHYVETRRARRLEADDGLDAAQWKVLLQLYDNTCVYCMEKFDQLEQDHVIPLSKGGRHSITNVVPACRSCNRHKSTGGLLVKHPVFGKLLIQAAKVARNG